jgi:hypothetical protein
VNEIGSLLGRWHQWRKGYSHERRYARPALTADYGMHDDDDFEAMLMQSMECEIEGMSQQHQLALQHVARAECLGVEVIMNNRLPAERAERESLCQQALRELGRRLLRIGIL